MEMSETQTHTQNDLIPGLPLDMAMECLLRVPITSHPTLRLVSHSFHAITSDPSFFLHRRRYGFSEHLLFLLQPPPLPSPPTTKPTTQSDSLGPPAYTLSLYNLTRREWGRLALPIPTFAQCVSVPSAGKVVVLGGWDPLTLEPVSTVLVIDLAEGTWKEGAHMPEKRSFFACAAVGSTEIYVAGGHDGRKNALKSAAVYDVVSDEWTVLPEMTEERDECHGLSFDGSRFWVISGYGTENQGHFRPDCELFDPETRTWTRIDGVWPHPNTPPKSTVSAGKKWLTLAEGELREFDWTEMRWKGSSSGSGLGLGRVPKRVSGSLSSLMVDVGNGEIFVMGNAENCQGEDCDEAWLGCGGDGAYIFTKGNDNKDNGNTDNNKGGGSTWTHVHAPSGCLGFPFSASHLLI